MACSSLCGYKAQMHRPHLTCLWCRQRRFEYGKLDPGKYHKNRFISKGKIIIPTNKREYIIFLKPPIDNAYLIVSDENRHFLRIKTMFLEKLASRTQRFIDRLDGKPVYVHVKDYAVQRMCTFMEFLAN